MRVRIIPDDPTSSKDVATAKAASMILEQMLCSPHGIFHCNICSLDEIDRILTEEDDIAPATSSSESPDDQAHPSAGAGAGLLF